MRRRLRQAAGVLAAVALTGLARPAPAQSNTFAATQVRPAATRDSDVSPATARLDEIQTEMAWLADEATFHCPLSAHAQEGHLVVSGTVPSAAVKTRVLQVAAQTSKLPVRDTLRVEASEAEVVTPATPAALHEDASRLLLRSLGTQTRGFDILALEHGILVVRGKVASYEDKLAVSRQLRQLSGVSAILNQLDVVAYLQQAQSVTRVSRDGKLTLAVVVPAPKPLIPAEASQPARPPAPEGDLGADNSSGFKIPTGSRTPATLADGFLSAEALTAPANTGCASGCSKCCRARAGTTIVPTGYQPNGSGEVANVPVPTGTDTTSSRLQPVPAAQYIVEPTQTTPGASHARGGLLIRIFGRNKDKESEPVVYPSSRLPSQGVVSTSSTPPAHFVPAGGPVPAAQTEIAPVTDRSGTPRSGVKASSPYVTNGVVLFDDARITATQPGAPLTAAVHAEFRDRVAAMCGPQARNVQVVVAPDKAVVVKMAVANEAAEREIRDKVLHLPEMQSAHMRLEITISP